MSAKTTVKRALVGAAIALAFGGAAEACSIHRPAKPPPPPTQELWDLRARNMARQSGAVVVGTLIKTPYPQRQIPPGGPPPAPTGLFVVEEVLKGDAPAIIGVAADPCGFFFRTAGRRGLLFIAQGGETHGDVETGPMVEAAFRQGLLRRPKRPL